MKRLIVAFVCQMLALASSANAQTGVSSTQIGKHRIVSVRVRVRDSVYDAKFDTDGQNIGGLNETDLNKRFVKVNSGTSVINFVVQNGYRMVGFSSAQAGSGAGISEGSNGYVVLFEQVE